MLSQVIPLWVTILPDDDTECHRARARQIQGQTDTGPLLYYIKFFMYKGAMALRYNKVIMRVGTLYNVPQYGSIVAAIGPLCLLLHSLVGVDFILT